MIDLTADIELLEEKPLISSRSRAPQDHGVPIRRSIPQPQVKRERSPLTGDNHSQVASSVAPLTQPQSNLRALQRPSTVPLPSAKQRRPPPPSEGLPITSMPKTSTLFETLRIFIACEGDRSLTKGRAAILTEVVRSNGGMIAEDPARATHVVVGVSQKYHPPETIDSTCLFVTTEWIVDCVSSGMRLPLSAYMYTPCVVAPLRSPEDSKGDDEKKNSTKSPEGYIPLFFQKGFVCQHGTDAAPSGDTVGTNPNQYIIDELTKLKDIYENTGDHWRKYAYNKAIGILKRHLKPIRSPEDIINIHGIGDKIAQKIEEIIKTGTSEKRKILEGCEEVNAIGELTQIWGVGPSTAKKLYLQGIQGIADLRSRPDVDTILTTPQLVGLKHVEDIRHRIPRAEVALIEAVVTETALKINPHLTVTTCGSYRRGKSDSGDVDILICDRRDRGSMHDGVLEVLVYMLKQTGFLVDELSAGYKSRKSGDHDSWMGMCRLPSCGSGCVAQHREDGGGHNPHLNRRLDIKVYPKEQYPFAVLYFTGSDYFNRSMRLYCQKLSPPLSLSDKDLRKVIRVNKEKVHEGETIPCQTEEDIFRALGLEYKTPQQRSV